MDWDTVIDKAIDYFEDNRDEYDECLDELNHWEDYTREHSDTIYEPMDYFDDYFSDVGSILEDVVDRLDSSFSSRDEYFYFDGYGNICSTDEHEYEDMLDSDFIDALYYDKDRIDLPAYIEKLFDAYDDDEDEDDEDEEEEEDFEGEDNDKE